MYPKEKVMNDPFYYLADIEREKIAAFCKDTVLYEALKKVFLAGIYENGVLRQGIPATPMRNWAMSFHDRMTPVSDEEIGREVRGFSWGINEIEKVFKRLVEIHHELPKVPETPKKNKAL